MKYKFSLILLLIFVVSFPVIGEFTGCACDNYEGPTSGPITITGDFGLTEYPNYETCTAIETSCGGIPLNTNSWTLVLVGVSLIGAGVFFTKKYSDE